MKIAFALCFVLLANASSFLSLQTGENCDSGASVYQISNFSVEGTVAKGQDVTFVFEGTFSQAETLKEIVADVSWNGISVLTQDIAENESVSAGEFKKISATVNLVSYAPSGSYTADLKLENTSGQFLSCWRYSFNL